MIGKGLVALAIPALCLGIENTQEETEWVCGNAVYPGEADDWVAMRRDAGIVLLEEQSLDYLRLSAGERAAAGSDVELREWDANPFDTLFCHDYLKRYKTPHLASRKGGICIRNDTIGARYPSILRADRNAREMWEWFGTENDYQQSAPKVKEIEHLSPFLAWGTGHQGTSPANWCKEYMREMMCHIAFPQFAGTQQDLDPSQVAGKQMYQEHGARVRPVCMGSCKKLMDNCNRREPNPATQVLPQIVEASLRVGSRSFYDPDDADIELNNNNWCKIWNKGVGLSQAGTGVAAGDNDDEELFCAQWDSSATASPLVFLTAAVVAIVAIF